MWQCTYLDCLQGRPCKLCAKRGGVQHTTVASPAVQGSTFSCSCREGRGESAFIVSSGVLSSVLGGYVSNLSSVSRRHSKQAGLLGPVQWPLCSGPPTWCTFFACSPWMPCRSTEWPSAAEQQVASTGPRLAPTLISSSSCVKNTVGISTA